MSKITIVTGYHVKVTPRSLGNFGSIRVSDRLAEPDQVRRMKMYKNVCDEIVDDIKRHVDETGYVEVIEETDSVCQHCGYEWTESSANYNGGCCDKDESGNNLNAVNEK